MDTSTPRYGIRNPRTSVYMDEGLEPNSVLAGSFNITDSDITIDGISLRDTLNKLQERLAILVPDPKKLEQYEALKQAYEHYKTLEGLCSSTENEDKK